MRWPRACFCRNISKATNIDNTSSQGQTDRNEEEQAGQLPDRTGLVVAIVRRIGKHKVVTAFLVIAIALLVELLTIPFVAIPRLASQNPAETSLMRQRIEEARANGKKLTITQKWVPLASLPRNLIDAVIVAEDGTFYSHGGVDWFEVRESLEKDIRERKATRGASTITQQLAKNLFLSTSKDPVRKAKELLITFLLEQTLSKDRILEIYLNVIEWGRGIFGVEAAAEVYFGKHASQLNLDEATRLAAVIPSPLGHTPEGDGKYVQRRQQIVLDRMAARRMISVPITGETITGTDTTSVPVPIDSEQAPGDSDTTGADEEGHDGL